MKSQGDGLLRGTVYVDGSLLDGHYKLCSAFRALGWAAVAVDDDGNITSIIHGAVPGWIDSIHGAEVWALLYATTHAQAGTRFRTDCKSVMHGSRYGLSWASTHKRRLARAWIPLAASVQANGMADAIAWLPAHTDPRRRRQRRLLALSR